MNKVYILLICLYAITISLCLYPFATSGDQEAYRELYTIVKEWDFFEGFLMQKNIIGAKEPIYYTLVFLSSNFLPISKNLLMSLLNVLLSFFLGKWLVKYRVSIIILVLLSMNFYLMVLFFSAEKLKLALLFFLIGVMYKRKLFVILSLVTHFQTMILYAGMILHDFLATVKSLFKKQFVLERRIVLSSIGGLIAIIFISAVFKDYLFFKISHYHAKNMGLVGVFKLSIFFILSIVYAPKNEYSRILSLFLSLFLADMLVGSSRIVIFGYLIFMYYGLQVNRGLNIGILLTTLFFSIKGVYFVYNMIINGDGFGYTIE